ncbi:MAG TPA: hypothetical protein VGE52_00760, partial [Pirellulales bacterium]
TNQLLEPISQASKLTSLTLPEMNADDETVKLLARLTNLTKLNLQSVDLSNADASPLAACTKLEVLDLSETNLGDAGMATIGKLTNLVEITLPKTLTDAGLEILAKLPRLRNASLYRCESLSDGAVAKLKAARPDLRIGR